MNFFELIKNTWIRKAGEVLKSWDSIQTNDQFKTQLEINDCLKDLWLNYDYIFKDRNTTFSTVVGQQDYNIPFNGRITNDGLLIQSITADASQVINSPIVYSNNKNEFIIDNHQGQPVKYTIYNQKIRLYPIPDKVYTINCFYETKNCALAVTNVNTDSLLGQNYLYVASTKEFAEGDNICIAPNTDNEEIACIQSITVSDTTSTAGKLTLIDNLNFNHLATKAERVIKEKQSLDYENDEPNFPQEYHNILCYMALMRILYNDSVRGRIYQSAYADALSNIIINSENAQSAGPQIKMTSMDWIR